MPNGKASIHLDYAPASHRQAAHKNCKIYSADAASVVVLASLACRVLFRRQTPPLSVQTDQAVRRYITETVVAKGEFYPVVQIHISPEVSDEITACRSGKAGSSTRATCF